MTDYPSEADLRAKGEDLTRSLTALRLQLPEAVHRQHVLIVNAYLEVLLQAIKVAGRETGK